MTFPVQPLSLAEIATAAELRRLSRDRLAALYEPAANFGRHNIEPPPETGSIPLRPATFVRRGSALT